MSDSWLDTRALKYAPSFEGNPSGEKTGHVRDRAHGDDRLT